VIVIKLLAILFVVLVSLVACGGDSDLKKEATQTAIQLDQANSAATSQQRASLIITHKSVKNDYSGVGGEPCDRAGLPGGVDCGGVTWRDSFGEIASRYISLDSQCWAEAAIGSDLPESCRR